MSPVEKKQILKVLAEKVMHWNCNEVNGDLVLDTKEIYSIAYDGGPCDDPRIWCPLQDMNHAIEMVQKMSVAPYYVDTWTIECTYNDNEPLYRCRYLNRPRIIQTGWETIHKLCVSPLFHPEPAEALCNAAYTHVMAIEGAEVS